MPLACVVKKNAANGDSEIFGCLCCYGGCTTVTPCHGNLTNINHFRTFFTFRFFFNKRWQLGSQWGTSMSPQPLTQTRVTALSSACSTQSDAAQQQMKGNNWKPHVHTDHEREQVGFSVTPSVYTRVSCDKNVCKTLAGCVSELLHGITMLPILLVPARMKVFTWMYHCNVVDKVQRVQMEWMFQLHRRAVSFVVELLVQVLLLLCPPPHVNMWPDDNALKIHPALTVLSAAAPDCMLHNSIRRNLSSAV